MLKVFKTFLMAIMIACFASSTPALATMPKLSQLDLMGDHLPSMPTKAIRRVMCDTGWGTGFIVGQDTMVTAYHVVAHQKWCRDDETGEPLEVVYYNGHTDVAVLKFTTTKASQWLKISCAGFVANQTYYSFGYPGVGQADLMMTRLRAEPFFEDGKANNEKAQYWHMHDLLGVVIPGMSGGPIIDEHGYVVGMNNLTGDDFHVALSRELKDTYFCPAKPSA